MSRRLIGYPTGWTLSMLVHGTDAGAAAEEIAPWRGTMPDLPQHIRG